MASTASPPMPEPHLLGHEPQLALSLIEPPSDQAGHFLLHVVHTGTEYCISIVLAVCTSTVRYSATQCKGLTLIFKDFSRHAVFHIDPTATLPWSSCILAFHFIRRLLFALLFISSFCTQHQRLFGVAALSTSPFSSHISVMASHPPQEPQSLAQRKRRGFFSQDLIDLVVPPFKVGVWTGTAGVLAGVGGAIARDTSPVASGIVTGIQWFTLGGTFWCRLSPADPRHTCPGS